MLPYRSSLASIAQTRLQRLSGLIGGAWFSKMPSLRHLGLLLLYVLATVQFVGAMLFLEFPYLNVHLWEYGYAPLPFQTRLLLAPLYRYVDTAAWSMNYASKLARNDYFFPRGIGPATVLEFFLDIFCVLIAGWVAVQFYKAGSRRRLVQPLVFPIFLGLCTLAYIVHTVQNFSYVYDLPSMAAFSVGLYLIYFKKLLIWFVLLFTFATLNRETTLLLLPFWVLSQIVEPSGVLRWRALWSMRVVPVVMALGLYWATWHLVVYGIFPNNASEYYPRIQFNLHCFMRLRYWPQLASASGFLWPFLIMYRRKLVDPQLRAWLLVLPLWFAFMFEWGILTETRIFGELFPFLAAVYAILAEEVFAAKVLRGIRHEAEPVAMQKRVRAA